MQPAPPVWITFLPFFVLMVITIYPASRILRKAGFSPWWSLGLLVVPVGWLIGLWVLAFARWPSGEAQHNRDVFS